MPVARHDDDDDDLIYMCERDLALNNLQGLICLKTQRIYIYRLIA